MIGWSRRRVGPMWQIGHLLQPSRNVARVAHVTVEADGSHPRHRPIPGIGRAAPRCVLLPGRKAERHDVSRRAVDSLAAEFVPPRKVVAIDNDSIVSESKDAVAENHGTPESEKSESDTLAGWDLRAGLLVHHRSGKGHGCRIAQAPGQDQRHEAAQHDRPSSVGANDPRASVRERFHSAILRRPTECRSSWIRMGRRSSSNP